MPAAVGDAGVARDHAPGLERAFAAEPPEGELPVAAVEGDLPLGLAGTYTLNGPARFAAGEVRYRNWLDGDGMVIAARFDEPASEGGAGVRVQQRFVATRKVVDERAAGAALFRTFGTRFAGDRLVHGVTVASPVNLSAYPFAGALLAFGEQGQPWELDRRTLATRGPGTFGGAITAATPFSGHPKVDPFTGELVTFGVSFAPREPLLHLFRFAADGTLLQRTRQPLPYPASIHDFALAGRHAVFHVAPHLLDLAALRDGATVLEALSWHPELGSRLLVLDRAAGRLVADVPVGERYCLHLLNASDEVDAAEPASRLTVDLLELDRPIYDDYRLPDLFVDSPAGRAVRYEVDLAGGRLVARRATAELGTVDFPTFDRRRATRSNDEGWVLQLSRSGERGRKFFDRLLHLRWDEGRVAGAWTAPEGTYFAGEPAFAPAGDEVGGVLVVPLWETASGQSSLALFTAGDVGAGPRATLRLGGRMPLGFHSFWNAAQPNR
ncbi:MAG TPA: carotenoid oxygenase family protein [Thermoanaerobaculia bacterium]|jgi:carotenoid cleavage dioxygenase|nr:carotenoid oxygenase family protein [Thermoanaerobaculia bacterium]